MTDYQDRVIAEENQLRDKFDKLEAFIAGDGVFPTLPEEDRNLLQEQRGYMSGYLSVLCRRIERFGQDAN